MIIILWNSAKLGKLKLFSLYFQNPPPVRTPAEYLTDYFSDQFYDSGAQFTNMYSVAKTGKPLLTTPVELKKFFGINLLMGCLPYLRLRMYWQGGIGEGGILLKKK